MPPSRSAPASQERPAEAPAPRSNASSDCASAEDYDTLEDDEKRRMYVKALHKHARIEHLVADLVRRSHRQEEELKAVARRSTEIFEDEIADLRGHLIEAKRAREQQGIRIAVLEESNANLKSDNEKLLGRVAVLEEENGKLKSDNQLLGRVAVLEEDNGKLQERVAVLEKSFEDAKQESNEFLGQAKFFSENANLS